jgi:hypothetical protein
VRFVRHEPYFITENKTIAEATESGQKQTAKQQTAAAVGLSDIIIMLIDAAC